MTKEIPCFVHSDELYPYYSVTRTSKGGFSLPEEVVKRRELIQELIDKDTKILGEFEDITWKVHKWDKIAKDVDNYAPVKIREAIQKRDEALAEAKELGFLSDD